MVNTRRRLYMTSAASNHALDNTIKRQLDPSLRLKDTKDPSSEAPGLLRLSAELRLMIYSHLLTSDRPFMIGRCQDDTKRKHNGSPRGWFARGRKIDHRPSLPAQPSITRICRQIRAESLPTFYNENTFWLIHNEFSSEPYEGTTKPDGVQRNFDEWLTQTPRQMFDLMQHVSLCGYVCWPSRIMISLDLKDRKLKSIRHYSIYGEDLPFWEGADHMKRMHVKEAFEETEHEDGWTALKAVLDNFDWIYNLRPQYICSPPGIQKRQPLSGPEYDF